MRIGIDGYEANVNQRVGIGRFAFELLKAIHHIDGSHEYTVFVPNTLCLDMPAAHKNWRYHSIKQQRLWTIRALPNAIKQSFCDVFFSPTHYIPLFSKIPKVAAIMDLSYTVYPSLFRISDLLKLRFGTAYTAHHARRIITISNFTKNAIIQHYRIAENRVVVAYPGFDRTVFHRHIDKNKKNTVLKKFNIDSEYIIYAGTLQPRKNITRLIDAFQKLKKRDIKLLIVGKKGWHYRRFFDLVKAQQLENHVQFIGFVADTELAALYAGARCFVLPSLYEGFGIPVVEAMATGTPVVVSNTSSLPEVTGDAGIFVNPFSSGDIAHGLHTALTLSTRNREDLIAKGAKQAKNYSWERSARTVIQTVQEAAHDSHT